MTTKQLKKKLGYETNELIMTNFGALDILAVKNGIVSYGLLAGGKAQTESVEIFINHFKGHRGVK